MQATAARFAGVAAVVYTVNFFKGDFMARFSSDRDILKYEAILLGDLHFPWQVLCEGTGGVLSSTTFSVSGEDFGAAGVGAGGVVYLRSGDGAIDGVYEIVSVDSASSLTVSVLRADDENDAIRVGDGSDVSYRIGTFNVQAEQVGFELTQYFGIRPGCAESEYGAEDVVDVSVLREASVFAVIAGVYATLGSGADDGAGYWKKSLHYQRLFEQARERCRLLIDSGNDGVSDVRRDGGIVRLVRD